MEVMNILKFLLMFIILSACSNSAEMETGEIKVLSIVRETLTKGQRPKIYVDAKKLINRDTIEQANIPVLYVKLETGQSELSLLSVKEVAKLGLALMGRRLRLIGCVEII